MIIRVMRVVEGKWQMPIFKGDKPLNTVFTGRRIDIFGKMIPEVGFLGTGRKWYTNSRRAAGSVVKQTFPKAKRMRRLDNVYLEEGLVFHVEDSEYELWVSKNK